jgi:hypothetical protein
MPSGWRTRLTGVSAIGVFVIAGVLRSGSLAAHSVVLAPARGGTEQAHSGEPA